MKKEINGNLIISIVILIMLSPILAILGFQIYEVKMSEIRHQEFLIKQEEKEILRDGHLVNVDEPDQITYPDYPEKITLEYACEKTWGDVWELRKYLANGEKIDYPLLYTWIRLYLDFWYKGDYGAMCNGGYPRLPGGDVWQKRIEPIIMVCSDFDKGEKFYYTPMLHIDYKYDQFWLEYNWVTYPQKARDLEWLFKSLTGEKFKEYVCSQIGYDNFATGDYKIYVCNFPGMSGKFDTYGCGWGGNSYDNLGYLSEVFYDAEELYRDYVRVSKWMHEIGMIDWYVDDKAEE